MNLLVHRYQIVRSLASGGFGETFLAKDTQLPDHPWCVVKQLKPQSDPQSWQIATRLFDTEARSLYLIGKKVSPCLTKRSKEPQPHYHE